MRIPYGCLKNYQYFGLIVSIPLVVISLIFSIIIIVMIQKNYNKTTSWENCGKFKGWALSWLILNYIGIILNIIDGCRSSSSDSE